MQQRSGPAAGRFTASLLNLFSLSNACKAKKAEQTGNGHSGFSMRLKRGLKIVKESGAHLCRIEAALRVGHVAVQVVQYSSRHSRIPHIARGPVRVQVRLRQLPVVVQHLCMQTRQ